MEAPTERHLQSAQKAVGGRLMEEHFRQEHWNDGSFWNTIWPHRSHSCQSPPLTA